MIILITRTNYSQKLSTVYTYFSTNKIVLCIIDHKYIDLLLLPIFMLYFSLTYWLLIRKNIDQ